MFRTLQSPKSGKFNITRLLAILTAVSAACILLIYALALFPQFFRYKDQMLEFSFTVVVITIMLFLATAVSYIFLKGKKGKFTGTLELKENEIVLNGTAYPISEIEKIRFKGNDIKGEFRGFKSKGTQNQVLINFKNNNSVDAYFEQTLENCLRDQKSILNAYHHAGILTESNYQNILNNTNYY